MRLVGGGLPQEGRVEILYNGEWGTVCDDRFEEADATVVCWQLGYSSGEARGNAAYGAGQGNIWLDEMECIGLEAEIGICSHNHWGSHDCTHEEDVGVYCRKYTVGKPTIMRCLTKWNAMYFTFITHFLVLLSCFDANFCAYRSHIIAPKVESDR